MRKLLFFAITISVMVSFSFVPNPVKYRRSVNQCGFSSWDAGVIWAGHTEWDLQQQGGSNFYVSWTWAGGDYCPSCSYCFTVSYDVSNPSLVDKDSPIVVTPHKLAYPPQTGETIEQLKSREIK